MLVFILPWDAHIALTISLMSTWKTIVLYCIVLHKANPRDLIAAVGLVILRKSSQKRRLFSLYNLEIWRMTSKIIGNLLHAPMSYMCS